MKISIRDVEKLNIFFLFFIYFGGYYVILILVANTVGNQFSRSFTIPLRVLIILSIVGIFLSTPRISLSKGVLFFLFFSCAYIYRIMIEIFSRSSAFHIPSSEFLFYYIAFVFTPLFFVSQIKCLFS